MTRLPRRLSSGLSSKSFLLPRPPVSLSASWSSTVVLRRQPRVSFAPVNPCLAPSRLQGHAFATSAAPSPPLLLIGFHHMASGLIGGLPFPIMMPTVGVLLTIRRIAAPAPHSAMPSLASFLSVKLVLLRLPRPAPPSAHSTPALLASERILALDPIQLATGCNDALDEA